MMSDRRTDAHAGLREARRRPHEPHTEVVVVVTAILHSAYDEPDAAAVHAEFDRLLRRQMHQLAGPRRVYRPRTGLPDLNNRAPTYSPTPTDPALATDPPEIVRPGAGAGLAGEGFDARVGVLKKSGRRRRLHPFGLNLLLDGMQALDEHCTSSLPVIGSAR
jgi:hypothetical protein